MTVLPRLGAIAAGQNQTILAGIGASRAESPFARYVESARTAERSARAWLERARESKEEPAATEEPSEGRSASNENAAADQERRTNSTTESVQTHIAVHPETGLLERPMVVVGEAAAAREEAATSSALVTPTGSAASALANQTTTREAVATPGVAVAGGSEVRPNVAPDVGPVSPEGDKHVPQTDAAVQTSPAVSHSDSKSTVPEPATESILPPPASENEPGSQRESRGSTSPGSKPQRLGHPDVAKQPQEDSVLREKVRLSVERIKGGEANPALPRGGLRANEVGRLEKTFVGDLTHFAGQASDESGVWKAAATSTVEAASGQDGPAASIGRFLLGEGRTANVSLTAADANPPRTTSVPVSTADAPLANVVHVDDAASTQTNGRWTDGPDLSGAARLLAASGGRGRWNATLQLDPPSLGRMTLQIRMYDQAMTLRVNAEAASVGRLVESRMNELRDALAIHGIRVDRAEVVARADASHSSGSDSDGRRRFEGGGRDSSTNSYFDQGGLSGESGAGGERWGGWFGEGGAADANQWPQPVGAYEGAATQDGAAAGCGSMAWSSTGDRSVDLWA